MSTISTYVGLGALLVLQTVIFLLLADKRGFLFVLGVTAAAPLAIIVPDALVYASARLRELCSQFRWWHFALLCMIVGNMSFRSRAVNDIYDSPVDIWAAFRIGAILTVVFLIAARSNLLMVFQAASRGLLGTISLSLALSLLSALWSVYPTWTAYKSFEVLCDITLIAAILSEASNADSIKSVFDWIWVTLTAQLACVWAGVVLWPDEAFIPGVGVLGKQLQGVFPRVSANGVGDLAAMLALVVVNRLFARMTRTVARRRLYVVLLVASLAALVMAQTRSALAAFVLGTLVIMLYWRRVGMVATVAGAATAILSVAAIADTARAYIVRNQNDEVFFSLTGRVVWWEAAWAAIIERPLLGYGAYAGSRFGLAEAIGSETPNIHNTYLETLLGTGVVGLVLLLVVITRIWGILIPAAARLNLPPPLPLIVVEAAGLMAMTTLRSVFSSNMLWHGALDFMLVVICAEFLRRARG